jgi:hypothetical protein
MASNNNLEMSLLCSGRCLCFLCIAYVILESLQHTPFSCLYDEEWCWGSEGKLLAHCTKSRLRRFHYCPLDTGFGLRLHQCLFSLSKFLCYLWKQVTPRREDLVPENLLFLVPADFPVFNTPCLSFLIRTGCPFWVLGRLALNFSCHMRVNSLPLEEKEASKSLKRITVSHLSFLSRLLCGRGRLQWWRHWR